jgi:hypothetical protein
MDVCGIIADIRRAGKYFFRRHSCTNLGVIFKNSPNFKKILVKYRANLTTIYIDKN